MLCQSKKDVRFILVMKVWLKIFSTILMFLMPNSKIVCIFYVFWICNKKEITKSYILIKCVFPFFPFSLALQFHSHQGLKTFFLAAFLSPSFLNLTANKLNILKTWIFYAIMNSQESHFRTKVWTFKCIIGMSPWESS